MSYDWITRQVAERPELFRLVHEFNRHPHHWVRPTYLKRLGHSEVVEFLSNQPSGISRASNWLSDQLGITEESPVSWNFERPGSRILLLDWKTMGLVACSMGAALHSQKLSTLISGDSIQKLRKQIGAEAYDFGLKGGGQVHFPERVRSLVEEWKPDIPLNDEDEALHLGEYVRSLGWAILICSTGELERSLKRRFQYKWPQENSEFLEKVVIASEEDVAACWKVTKSTVRKLLSKRELQCFDWIDQTSSS